MRIQSIGVGLMAVWIGLCTGKGAQAEALSVPVRGLIDSDGIVELTVTFYGRAVGGTALYSVTRDFQVIEHTYFDMVDVPSSLFRGRERVFFEVSRSSTPGIVLAERSQFTYLHGAPPLTLLGCTLCFTCGGLYPVFGGAFSTTSPVTARSSSCSGQLGPKNFSHPFICCQ